MGPERRKAVTLVNCSQCEGAPEPRLAPALAAVLRAASNNGLGCALGDSATDGQAIRREGHVSHAVLVVAEVNEVFPELPLLRGGQLRVAALEVALDAIDRRVLQVETFLPFSEAL